VERPEVTVTQGTTADDRAHIGVLWQWSRNVSGSGELWVPVIR
jgi:hypothetical protein